MSLFKPYSQWDFFDKRGNPYSFVYDEDTQKWTGEVYLDPVSVGLIENEHIFIVEKFLQNVERNLYLPKSVLGVPAGFAKFIFSINVDDEFSDDARFIWKDCDGGLIQWYRKDYTSNEAFYEAIITDIKALSGYGNSFRSGNEFTIVVDLSVANCIDIERSEVQELSC